MNPELKPCPFCGSRDLPTWFEIPLIGRTTHKVCCGCCSTTGPIRYSEAEAIASWNERVPISPTIFPTAADPAGGTKDENDR